MRAIILSTGDELILGEATDTNARDIARELAKLGHELISVRTIPDEFDSLISELKNAIAKADIIIGTGGLGPTIDDLSRHVIAEAISKPLLINEQAKVQVEEKLKRKMLESDMRQALIPEGCSVIPNKYGTAPGIHAKTNNATIYWLSGVPHEMNSMLQDSVLSDLSETKPSAPLRRYLVTHGMPEAVIADKLAGLNTSNLKIGTRASGGVVKIRISATSAEAINRAFNNAREILNDAVVDEGNISLAEILVQKLTELNATISTAESCTGGLIAGELVSVSGASNVFNEGFVTYANAAKTKILGVPKELIEAHGVVSEEIASAMADGTRKISAANISIAVTGIAGPKGGSKEKPVGTVWIASSTCERTLAKRFNFRGDRTAIRQRAKTAALTMALDAIK